MNLNKMKIFCFAVRYSCFDRSGIVDARNFYLTVQMMFSISETLIKGTYLHHSHENFILVIFNRNIRLLFTIFILSNEKKDSCVAGHSWQSCFRRRSGKYKLCVSLRSYKYAVCKMNYLVQYNSSISTDGDYYILSKYNGSHADLPPSRDSKHQVSSSNIELKQFRVAAWSKLLVIKNLLQQPKISERYDYIFYLYSDAVLSPLTSHRSLDDFFKDADATTI